MGKLGQIHNKLGSEFNGEFMSLLSRLRERFWIDAKHRATDELGDSELIHGPSLAIGDSLGDIKVGVMHLKTQLERIEACMLSKEYFDQSMESRDQSDLMLGKLDEALRVLTEYQPRRPSIEPSKPSIEPRTPSSEPSLTEEAEDYHPEQTVSLRLQEVLKLFRVRRRSTPRQISKLLGISSNTACEHLRKLEGLRYLRRVRKGLYEISR